MEYVENIKNQGKSFDLGLVKLKRKLGPPKYSY